jgi:uncharacterized protein
MRVFLDANVLFSGAQEGSPMRQFLEVLARHSSLIVHPVALDEARRNLALKRPTWLSGLDQLARTVTLSEAMGAIGGVHLADKDRPVLQAAVGARCTHLLTGDVRHFGHLFGKTVAGVRITSPRLLAEDVAARGWLD